MAAFNLGSTTFSSKKEAGQYFGSLLKNRPVGHRLSDVELENIIALIERHPEAAQKIGCGIKSIIVKQNPVFKNQKTFYIERSDGSETDFSFRVCLRGKPNTAWFDFCAAARNAVTTQILTFKQAQFLSAVHVRCGITGCLADWNSCHVDHVVPFSELLKNFIHDNKITIREDMVSTSVDNQVTPEFSCCELKSKWQEYHKRNAVLRITTPEANLSRNKTA